MAEGLTQRKKGAAHSGAATVPAAASSASAASSSLFSSNPSKRRGEIFFLLWSPCWVAIMAFIVLTRWFESFTPTHYMITGLVICLPPIVLPLLFPGADRALPWQSRYTTKANVWIFILAWMANYFWTHYFYHVLGTAYTLDVWRLNDVPFAFFLISHSYFHLYHSLSNIAIRVSWRKFGSGLGGYVAVGILIAVMSWTMAFMETFTIQNFPYYTIPDRWAMYIYGSMFYALYFIPSFAMFFRLDEEVGQCWSLTRSALDSLACCMLITQLLDVWRLWIGPIVDLEKARQFALDNTPAHLIGKVLPPSRSNGVPFV